MCGVERALSDGWGGASSGRARRTALASGRANGVMMRVGRGGGEGESTVGNRMAAAHHHVRYYTWGKCGRKWTRIREYVGLPPAPFVWAFVWGWGGTLLLYSTDTARLVKVPPHLIVGWARHELSAQGHPPFAKKVGGVSFARFCANQRREQLQLCALIGGKKRRVTRLHAPAGAPPKNAERRHVGPIQYTGTCRFRAVSVPLGTYYTSSEVQGTCSNASK